MGAQEEKNPTNLIRNLILFRKMSFFYIKVIGRELLVGKRANE